LPGHVVYGQLIALRARHPAAQAVVGQVLHVGFEGFGFHGPQGLGHRFVEGWGLGNGGRNGQANGEEEGEETFHEQGSGFLPYEPTDFFPGKFHAGFTQRRKGGAQRPQRKNERDAERY
jgi:hypothetical protein